MHVTLSLTHTRTNVRSNVQQATNKNYNNNFFNSLSKACHTLIGLLTNLNGVPGPWHNGKS